MRNDMNKKSRKVVKKLFYCLAPINITLRVGSAVKKLITELRPSFNTQRSCYTLFVPHCKDTFTPQ